MKYHTFNRLALAAAIAAALVPGMALAQADNSNDASADKREDNAKTLDMVIVSGATQFKGLSKGDASFSVTTMTPEQIDDAGAKSTADLLKVVPGLWVEATGGETGANIDVRGFPGGSDAPFVTLQLDGSPIFPPPTLSFLENSSLFRIDSTIDRVEVLRGGPSPVFSNGQTGATVNFITRRGSEIPEGELRATVSDNGLYRVDGFYSGPISDDWFFSVGGFYREDDGVRDTQFPANEGGQFSATISHTFDAGEFSFSARHLDDKNAFFTAVPLVANADGGISRFGNFDPTEDTLIGRDFRNVTLQVTPGDSPGTIDADLANGRGADLDMFGSTLDLNFGGWTLSNRANYLSGDAPTNGLFTGANPQTLSSFIDGQIGSVNGNADIVAAAGGLATSGAAQFVNGGGAVSGDQQVMVAGFWIVRKDIESFTDEVRLSRELFDGNTLTVGAYYADYSSKDRWYLGNNMLLTAEPNARRIDVALDNGVEVTRDGFTGASFFSVNADYDGDNIAGFIADEWEFADRWKLDLGVRFERQTVDAILENIESQDLDNNLLTLSNNSASVLNGTFREIHFDDNESSFTAGLNYKLAESASVFARFNTGYAFPQFDNLRDGQDNTQQIDQYEIGLKTSTELYSLFLTGFYNKFDGLQFQLFDLDGNNITQIGGSHAQGIEYEAQLRPTDNFAIDLTGSYVDAEFRNFGSNSGNRVRRQAKNQFRLTPSYFIPGQWGDLRFFGTWSHVGKRFSDNENQQLLPSYDTIDLGVVAYIGDNWEVRVQGSNVTDELALTEGNARIVGDSTSGGTGDRVFLGRAIQGTNYQATVTYRF
ncbi:MAG: TonB-dependent receptor [Gammaproteobacteria bacterium HGW-Gammaproteobacteria-4]|jgi:outer membrane receptor protein involved in Fe transport|nr:MAG: TonB-dependent receptor [Gammaproteobacteria bacterium HGW-Gammaproteobacteria-4]